MDNLIAPAQQIAELLKARGETVAVVESSAGGLISAALLSIGGASAYFIGGAIVYTRDARSSLLEISETALEGIRPSTEAYAMLLARTARDRMGTTWAVAETGATGPTGNRYGDPPGHVCLGVAGPVDMARTIETASDDRVDNMRAFALAALNLLLECVTG